VENGKSAEPVTAGLPWSCRGSSAALPFAPREGKEIGLLRLGGQTKRNKPRRDHL